MTLSACAMSRLGQAPWLAHGGRAAPLTWRGWRAAHRHAIKLTGLEGAPVSSSGTLSPPAGMSVAAEEVQIQHCVVSERLVGDAGARMRSAPSIFGWSAFAAWSTCEDESERLLLRRRRQRALPLRLAVEQLARQAAERTDAANSRQTIAVDGAHREAVYYEEQ